MTSRTLNGLMLGLVGGAFVGAAGIAASEALFGRGLGVLGPSPRLAALIGAVLTGLPGALVGALVGGLRLGPAPSFLLGAATGVLLALPSLWTGEPFTSPGGSFDWQRFSLEALADVTLVLGLAAVAALSSAGLSASTLPRAGPTVPGSGP